MNETKHNPILNGTTKRMIWSVSIMIAIITITSLLLLAILLLVKDYEKLSLWVLKGIFGTITLTGLGALSRMTRIFMDTRTSQEKDKYNLEKYEIKYNYKLEKLKVKSAIIK